MRPSAGRVVHYVPDSPAVLVPDDCQAALVTAVEPPGDAAVLTVFAPGAIVVFSEAVEHDEDGKAPGTWHWPERVPELWAAPA